MTGVSFSGSKEHFTKDYADPSTCTYITYPCTYCQEEFYLVNPDNFAAGGAIRLIQYRNKKTGKIVSENRACGVCLRCAQEIMRRQQQQ